MSCCLDTDHFVGTPTFFRVIMCIFTLWGKGKLFLPVFLCYLATMTACFPYFSGREKKSVKVCAACKCQSLVCLQMTQLQCPMGCHGHHAILCNLNRFIFGDNKNFWYLVVPLNNFVSMNNCPWVQVKSNKPPPPPPPPEVCVGGRGE